MRGEKKEMGKLFRITQDFKTPNVVEGYFFADIHDKREIAISPNTEELQDKVFYRNIFFTKDDAGKVVKIGKLETVFIPYGIDMLPGSFNSLCVDDIFLGTGVPVKTRDRIEFVVYDPEKVHYGKNRKGKLGLVPLFSISYPVNKVRNFCDDYYSIMRGQFKPLIYNIGGNVKVEAYNGFVFEKKNKVLGKYRKSYFGWSDTKDSK